MELKDGLMTEPGKILPTESRQFKSWLKSNSFHLFKDSIGGEWMVEIDYIELPHPNDMKGGVWKINVGAST